jgi:PAS domain S-box-containing protein
MPGSRLCARLKHMFELTQQPDSGRFTEVDKALLADFFHNKSVGFFCVDSKGVIIEANRAHLELLGYQPQEYIGRQFADFYADKAVFQAILQKFKAQEVLVDFEASLKGNDGSSKYVLISSGPCQECSSGHVRCYTRDITKRKLAEQKILQLNAELEEKVRRRTAELERKNAALKELNRNLVGREYRIRELERENQILRQRLEDGPQLTGWFDGQTEGMA